MRMTNTRAALNYWMELFYKAGNRPYQDHNIIWPDRSAIRPSECSAILGDMFILDTTGIEPAYRLAGSRLCSMFGQEMRHVPFSQYHRPEDQNVVSGWADQLSFEHSLVLLCSRAANAAGETVNLETLLMPLSNGGRAHERILGITVPAASPYWLGQTPVKHLTLLTVRAHAPWRDTAAAKNGGLRARRSFELRDMPQMRRVGHLGVLDGGRGLVEKNAGVENC